VHFGDEGLIHRFNQLEPEWSDLKWWGQLPLIYCIDLGLHHYVSLPFGQYQIHCLARKTATHMRKQLAHGHYVKRSSTWHSAAPRWTHAQERFTTSEVAADCLTRYRGALCWHPSPMLANNWTRGAAHRHTITPISYNILHSVAHKLLLITCPAKGRRLSWPEHTVV